MAKKSQSNRDNRRAQLIAKHAAKRAELRKRLKDEDVPMEEKFAIQQEFAKLPRNSCPTRLNRRCQVTGRSHAFYASSRSRASRCASWPSAVSSRAFASRAGRKRSERAMKAEIHPDYHKVLFVDSATGTEWMSRSTMTSQETREVDGEEVPVVKLEISAASHPFWTGQLESSTPTARSTASASATARRSKQAAGAPGSEHANARVRITRAFVVSGTRTGSAV